MEGSDSPTIEGVIEDILRKERGYTDVQIASWWDTPHPVIDHASPRQYVEDGHGVKLLQYLNPSWR